MPAQPRKATLGIIDFTCSGLSKSDALVLTERLLLEIANTNVFDVIERSERDEILKEQGFSQSGACNETACLIQIGRFLSVEKMIGGSIGKFGQTWLINTRLIDVSTGRIEKVAKRNYKGEMDGIIGVIEEVGQEVTCGYITSYQIPTIAKSTPDITQPPPSDVPALATIPILAKDTSTISIASTTITKKPTPDIEEIDTSHALPPVAVKTEPASTPHPITQPLTTAVVDEKTSSASPSSIADSMNRSTSIPSGATRPQTVETIQPTIVSNKGSLRIICNVEGAHLFFDDKDRGLMFGKENLLNKIKSGPHKIALLAIGYDYYYQPQVFITGKTEDTLLVNLSLSQQHELIYEVKRDFVPYEDFSIKINHAGTSTPILIWSFSNTNTQDLVPILNTSQYSSRNKFACSFNNAPPIILDDKGSDLGVECAKPGYEYTDKDGALTYILQLHDMSFYNNGYIKKITYLIRVFGDK